MFSTVLFAVTLLPNEPIFAAHSQLIAYTIGTFWSYYWNRRYTFRSSESVAVQMLKFVIVQTSLALLSSILIYFTITAFSVQRRLAWFFVMSIITIMNYVLLRSIVFRRQTKFSRA